MSLYDNAKELKKYLSLLIDDRIEKNDGFKYAIKAQKAYVLEEPADGLVKVVLIGDFVANFVSDGDIPISEQPALQEKALILRYNPVMEAEDLGVGKMVSVWYSNGLQNAIVMQSALWDKGGNGGIKMYQHHISVDIGTGTLHIYPITPDPTPITSALSLTSQNKLTRYLYGARIVFQPPSGLTSNGFVSVVSLTTITGGYYFTDCTSQGAANNVYYAVSVNNTVSDSVSEWTAY